MIRVEDGEILIETDVTHEGQAGIVWYPQAGTEHVQVIPRLDADALEALAAEMQAKAREMRGNAEAKA